MERKGAQLPILVSLSGITSNADGDGTHSIGQNAEGRAGCADACEEGAWGRFPELGRGMDAPRELARAFLSFPGQRQGRKNHGPIK